MRKAVVPVDSSSECHRSEGGKQQVQFVMLSSRIIQACECDSRPPAAFSFMAMRRDGL